MAWEWSHTDEAYAYAREHVSRLSKGTLLTVLREWAYQDRETAGRPGSFRLPAGVRRLNQSTLADLVWDRAEEYHTCSNGGWEAYVCPDGCHTVPFGPKT